MVRIELNKEDIEKIIKKHINFDSIIWTGSSCSLEVPMEEIEKKEQTIFKEDFPKIEPPKPYISPYIPTGPWTISSGEITLS